MTLTWIINPISPDHNYQGDGTGWLSFTGEINVDSEVTIGGFKAAALWVKVRNQIPSPLFFLKSTLHTGLHRFLNYAPRRAQGPNW
jgi:hypothetical protein